MSCERRYSIFYLYPLFCNEAFYSIYDSHGIYNGTVYNGLWRELAQSYLSHFPPLFRGSKMDKLYRIGADIQTYHIGFFKEWQSHCFPIAYNSTRTNRNQIYVMPECFYRASMFLILDSRLKPRE